MESTPVQKVIDPDRERAKIKELAQQLDSIRENNKTLESAVVSNESVIVKIDEFLKEFNYNNWKEKETQIEQLNFQIREDSASVATLEEKLETVKENKTFAPASSLRRQIFKLQIYQARS